MGGGVLLSGIITFSVVKAPVTIAADAGTNYRVLFKRQPDVGIVLSTEVTLQRRTKLRTWRTVMRQFYHEEDIADLTQFDPHDPDFVGAAERLIERYVREVLDAQSNFQRRAAELDAWNGEYPLGGGFK